MGLFHKAIKLPRTIDEYDRLVELVIKTYKLTDATHASAIISVAIRQLKPTQSTTTLKYFGDYILKDIANHIARHKSSILQHSAEVNHLALLLEKDPSDTEARDKLQAAANDGSEEAKAILLRLAETNVPEANA